MSLGAVSELPVSALRVATQASGDGSAAGSCSVSAEGESVAASAGSAAGSCSVTGVGSTTESSGLAAGTCTVSGEGKSLAFTDGTSAGSSGAYATIGAGVCANMMIQYGLYV